MTDPREYLVLARKCRPQSFTEVVGQEHVLRTLRNAIVQGRVAHAFIFSGPRGVGKTSVARILAKALNCAEGPTPSPCGRCTSCSEIAAGISLDVREIDGASNRGIDEIRELRENVKFLPASGRRKIYIIDEVHMLTREAFNALLKTLEEPPAHVVFVFATTEAQKIPATIVSRCQCFEFRRIPLRELTAALGRIAETEGIHISREGLAWIAEAGDGSLRDAQSIFDQIISFAGSDIQDRDVEEVLGLLDRRFLFAISESVLARDAARCLRIVEEAHGAGLEMMHVYQMLLRHFRDLLLVCLAGDDADEQQIPEESVRRLREQASGATRETLQRLLDLLMAEEENIRRSRNPRWNLEAALVRMALLEPVIPIAEILRRLEGMEKGLTAGAGIAPGSADGAPLPGPRRQDLTAGSAGTDAAAGPVEPETGDSWDGFKAFVKKHHSPLWSKIEPGVCLGLEKGRLTVGFPGDYLFLEDLRGKALQSRLAELAGAFFQAETVVVVETVAANGSASRNENGAQKANARQERKREALNNPLLQKILDAFPGAEVREIHSREHPTQT